MVRWLAKKEVVDSGGDAGGSGSVRKARLNDNQEVRKRLLQMEQIRKRHQQEAAAKEEKPYGKADRHVIEAWTEIENEDKADMLKKLRAVVVVVIVVV